MNNSQHDSNTDLQENAQPSESSTELEKNSTERVYRKSNTFRYGIDPMSLFWLLLAGGTAGTIWMFCFGDVASVTHRVALNVKAFLQAPQEIRETLQPPATLNYTDADTITFDIKFQAQKEAFEKACRSNEAEVLPEGRYPLGVYTVRGGGEGEYLTYTTILIPTGNICTFSSGNAEKAVNLAQWYKNTKPVQPWKAGV